MDAFVAIEENIQISNLNEYGRGEEKRSDLKEVAEDKTAPDIQKKAKKLLEVVDKIDKMTAEQIKMIDDMKTEILTTCNYRNSLQCKRTVKTGSHEFDACRR